MAPFSTSTAASRLPGCTGIRAHTDSLLITLSCSFGAARWAACQGGTVPAWHHEPVAEAERTVVIIEDDPSIADLLDLYLREGGFRPLQAASGMRGLELVEQHQPALVVLDIGLPDIDGFEVCRRIRARSSVPVLFLTARDGEIDRVLGLELGADDYVVKPFSPRELVARVKAILRRGQPPAPAAATTLSVGEMVDVDVARREARVRGVAIPLATKEFDLLAHFARNQGLALSRQQLLDAVWGADWYGDDRTVDVHVRQLRKKLGDDLPLATVWGVGYRLG
ncbi:MAG TPA: DNA-binding response regulator [Acidimicrobiaceae bacterium]|nr:DNA-binding response regulator [Acidimicrobiaceae bacterium]